MARIPWYHFGMTAANIQISLGLSASTRGGDMPTTGFFKPQEISKKKKEKFQGPFHRSDPKKIMGKKK